MWPHNKRIGGGGGGVIFTTFGSLFLKRLDHIFLKSRDRQQI